MAETTHVWIAQCLCPERHCILSAADEAATESEAQATVQAPLREQVTQLLASGLLNPWCGLCHAGVSTWHYEVERTRFASMEEAEPVLRQSEAEQAVARAIFGDIPRND
jgi:hypothetical protein